MRVRGAVFVVTLLLVAAPSAGAAVPTTAITSSGPLTNVWIGNELGCQISYAGDASYELFPPSAVPGDCGTFLAVGGVLFAPNFASHTSTATSSLGAYTPFTPVSQSAVTGGGTGASPYRVTTVAAAGTTGMQVTQIDSYVVGQESYRTDVTVANTGGASQSVIVYRAGDCYLQGTDVGYGFLGPGAGAVGCSANANNSPAGRIEQWLPITGGNTWLESTYSSVWSTISARTPLANLCGACTNSTDNGAGVAWSLTVPAGGRVTVSHYTTFSPLGNSAPPPTTSSTTPTVPSAFGPNGVIQGLPSGRACLSKRHFTIHIRRYPRISYTQAIVFLNHHVVRSVKSRKGQFSAAINLRGLPAGTFPVKITVITTTGSIISGTRTYHTCHKRIKSRGRGRL